MSRIATGTPAFRRITLALTAAGFSTFTVLYCVQPLLPIFTNEFHVSPTESSLTQLEQFEPDFGVMPLVSP